MYLWDAATGTVKELMEMASDEDYVSSVSWAANGKYLAIGSSTATIQVSEGGREGQFLLCSFLLRALQ